MDQIQYALLLATYENNIWHYEPKQLWTTRLGQRNSDGTLRTESMEASYQAFTEIKTSQTNMGWNTALVLPRALFVKHLMALNLWTALANIVRWNGVFSRAMKRLFMALMVP